jgi:hypothetical protein
MKLSEFTKLLQNHLEEQGDADVSIMDETGTPFIPEQIEIYRVNYQHGDAFVEFKGSDQY